MESEESKRLASIRRWTIGQTAVQAGTLLELDAQNRQLGEQTRLLEMSAASAERQTALLRAKLDNEQEEKLAAMHWRELVVKLSNNIQDIATLPDTPIKTASIALVQRTAKVIAQAHNPAIPLQEMLSASETIRNLAKLEREHLRQRGITETAEDYCNRRLEELLPAVREIAKAIKHYAEAMAGIRERLATKLTIPQFHELIAEEAATTGKLENAFKHWETVAPQAEELAGLGGWQSSREGGKAAQEENISVLLQILQTTSSGEGPIVECDKAIAANIKEIQGILDGLDNIRSDYVHALDTFDTIAVAKIKNRADQLSLFAGEKEIATLEARYTEVLAIQQRIESVSKRILDFFKAVRLKMDSKPSWPTVEAIDISLKSLKSESGEAITARDQSPYYDLIIARFGDAIYYDNRDRRLFAETWDELYHGAPPIEILWAGIAFGAFCLLGGIFGAIPLLIVLGCGLILFCPFAIVQRRDAFIPNREKLRSIVVQFLTRNGIQMSEEMKNIEAESNAPPQKPLN